VKSNLDTEIASPLDQFEVRDLLSLDAPILANLHISLTNIGLYLTIGALIALSLKILATNYNRVVSNRWSVSQESIYATVHSIVINQINTNKGQIFFLLSMHYLYLS
jgi:F-type H+-transporting ATPase subunit a